MVGWAAGSVFEEVGGEDDGGEAPRGSGLMLRPGWAERHPWAAQESRPGQSPPWLLHRPSSPPPPP